MDTVYSQYTANTSRSIYACEYINYATGPVSINWDWDGCSLESEMTGSQYSDYKPAAPQRWDKR